MLNKAGRAAGISERSLLTGPESRAQRYASEELLEHWRTPHRPTAAFFEGKDIRMYERYTPSARRGRAVARRTISTGSGRNRRTVSVTVRERAA